MNSLLYWFFEIVCLLVPTAFLTGRTVKSGNATSGDIVFMALAGLMVGSWIGLLVNVSTWGVAVAFTAVFFIYLWRGRG
jgi:Ca2+/Na+ antiporter